MNDSPESPDSSLSPTRKIVHILVLATAVILLPTGIACLFSGFFRTGTQRQLPAQPSLHLPKHLADLSDKPEELEALRQEMLAKGMPTDQINLKIWASRGVIPERLFNIAPPQDGHAWNWKLSADGLLALAYTQDTDAKGHRIVGLYDLVAAGWRWQKEISWPATCDKPQAIPGYLLVRYFLNGRSFVMEVDPKGVITTIEPVGRGTQPTPQPLDQDPRIPYQQFDRANGVSFAVTEQGALVGYAAAALPGVIPLRDARENETALSGNGRIQFLAEGHTLKAYDTISGVSLAAYPLFQPEEGLAVHQISADLTGRRVEVLLRPRGRNELGGVCLPAGGLIGHEVD